MLANGKHIEHNAVLGEVGSGKTTTVISILWRLMDEKMPFLVLAPTRREYRLLAHGSENEQPVRIYTPGSEEVAPLRWNPFEFEMDEQPHSSLLQTHLDLLLIAFAQSLGSQAPHPTLLMTALSEMYAEKGWDLVSGRNTRLPDWSKRGLYPIFPTLTDACRIVKKLVAKVEAAWPEDETRRWIAFLQWLQNLRVGSQGCLWDTPRGNSLAQLLLEPTVIELEFLTSDAEKTLLLCLFYTRLYEYRRLQIAREGSGHIWRHTLILEEAHRLFPGVLSHSLHASPRLVQLLAELRAYGQKLVLMAPSPMIIDSQALLQCGVFSMHRLRTQAELMALRQACDLTDEQCEQIRRLPVGEKLIMALDEEAMLQAKGDLQASGMLLDDQALRALSPQYISIGTTFAIADIDQYGVRLSPFGVPEALFLYQKAGLLLENEQGRWLLTVLFTRAVHQPAMLLDTFTRLAQLLETMTPLLPPSQHDLLLRMLIIRSCQALLDERGDLHSWTYPQVEELRLSLTSGLVALLQTHDLRYASADLDRFARKYIDRTRRKYGPFPGCVHCRARCAYHTEVQNLLVQSDQDAISAKLQPETFSSQRERYISIASYVCGVTIYWLGGRSAVIQDMGYCTGLHLAAALDLSEYDQIQFSNLLKPYLLS